MLARRDTGEKQAVTLDALEQTITSTLEDIQQTMYEKLKNDYMKNIKRPHNRRHRAASCRRKVDQSHVVR